MLSHSSTFGSILPTRLHRVSNANFGVDPVVISISFASHIPPLDTIIHTVKMPPRRRAATPDSDDNERPTKRQKIPRFDWNKDDRREQLLHELIRLKADHRMTDNLNFREEDLREVRDILSQRFVLTKPMRLKQVENQVDGGKKRWRYWKIHRNHLSGWSFPVDGPPSSTHKKEVEHFEDPKNKNCRPYWKKLPPCLELYEELYGDGLATGDEALEADQLQQEDSQIATSDPVVVDEEDGVAEDDGESDAAFEWSDSDRGSGEGDADEETPRPAESQPSQNNTAIARRKAQLKPTESSSPAPSSSTTRRVHRAQSSVAPSESVSAVGEGVETAFAWKSVVNSFGVARSRGVLPPQSAHTAALLKLKGFDA